MATRSKPSRGRTFRGSGGYVKTELPNGLRVVSESIPSVRSISIGVWIDVGSRNESPDINGLSHFLEHMVFKRTERRDARQIAAALESLGGGLNGFTSREHTCYTARILDEHLDEAIDVLSDMACHAKLAAHDMKKERLVICEEIKEVLDTPSDHIHDLFARAYWQDHPLGQPIMGTQENVLGMTPARMKAYRSRNYRTGSIVIAASGNVSHNKLVKLVREKFSFEEGEADPVAPAPEQRSRLIDVHHSESAQTHLCLGFPAFPYKAKEKMPALVMSAYLGGGMSSVLFQKIREERGLAYSVFTFHDFYHDSGLFGAYLGTDAQHARRAYDVIIKECRRLKKRKLSAGDLEQTKAQLKGHYTIGLESTSARMNRLARLELMTGKFTTMRQVLNQIDRVTAEEVLEVANLIFDEDRLAMAVLGPLSKDVFSDVA